MEKITGYSKNLNVQMLIQLMLANHIKRVVISPGATHLEIVAGLQYNGSFMLYSSIDERGAAYMAVGLAAESGEPVAIVCTESVASRNYFPAMTEAHYRQLPILAITGVHGYTKIGHLHSQIIDRSVSPKDTFRFKVHLPAIKDADDVWYSNVLLNQAFIELKRHGGGPVHIDLPSSSMPDFSVGELSKTRVIRYYQMSDKLPTIPQGRIAVLLGSHPVFNEVQTAALDNFCATYDAVVFCDHTSGYNGDYKVLSYLSASQVGNYDIFTDVDLLIHIGNPSADDSTQCKLNRVKEVWRVNPDGEIRDTFKKLSAVFEMEESNFFAYYADTACPSRTDYLMRCRALIQSMKIPVEKLPFSNIYTAAILSAAIPQKSLIHLGLSTTIRSYSMFGFPQLVCSNCNVGTRGIDGVLSTFIGASFVDTNKLCFCVLGDLTFFYDMNALGNRSIRSNVRILLVNDGGGGLFKTSSSAPHRYLGDNDLEPYIGASGHFGNKSKTLVKGYVESLGFEYMTASSKEEFDRVYPRFVLPELTEKPMFFEIFTNADDERAAFDIMQHIDITVEGMMKQTAKQLLGDNGTRILKKIIRK